MTSLLIYALLAALLAGGAYGIYRWGASNTDNKRLKEAIERAENTKKAQANPVTTAADANRIVRMRKKPK